MLAPWAFLNVGPFAPLNLEKHKKLAIKAAKGLTDFGDDWYEEPFRQTMNMVNKSGYSPIGKASAHDFFLRRLVARLRLRNELSSPAGVPLSHPCLNESIRAPIFVVGLPRTGTTYLHRLLSLDPNARAPKTWELFDPVPVLPAAVLETEEGRAKDRAKRIKFVDDAIKKLDMCVPHFKGIHEVGGDLPEECMASIGCDIPMLFSTFHVLIRRPYEAFGWRSGQAYKNYKMVLQLLQYQAASLSNFQAKEKRWTLKCPVHLGLLEFLSEGFPDATVVWTHREPKESVGSLASFVRATQDMHEGKAHIDLKALGDDVLHFGGEWIKRADEFLAKNDKKKHPRSSVMYEELIKDPISTVKKLYKDIGLEFTDEYERRLKIYIDEDKKKREALKKKVGGSGEHLHSYDIADFGIEEEAVNDKLGWYKKKYFPTVATK